MPVVELLPLLGFVFGLLAITVKYCQRLPRIVGGGKAGGGFAVQDSGDRRYWNGDVRGGHRRLILDFLPRKVWGILERRPGR